MRRVMGVTLVVALLWLVAAPVTAAKDPIPDPQVPLTGTFIDTFTDGAVSDIAAGEPFFIENGWCGFANERVALLNPGTAVRFTMDGTPLVAGTIVDMHFPLPDLGCEFAKFNYRNFRAGLPAGTYTFVATFMWLDENLGSATTTLIVH